MLSVRHVFKGRKISIKTVLSILILYLFAAQITSVYADDFPEIVPPVYSAASVVLMEASTGMVLYASNGDEIKYPASITKVMTALIVLEQVEDLQERVLFSDRAIWGIPRNSSHIAMDVGETLSVYEALYGLMLESGNDVSMALAEHVAGSVEGFVTMMNRRAYSLGAFDTYFVNPSGLPGAGHVTTAYDFALIMREAVRHPVFVDIISARRFDIPPTERQTEVRALLNSNRMIQPGPLFNDSVVGGKTGWTTAAGHTLVTYAQQDGRRLIVSVLGGDSPGMFTDTTALLNFGFSLPFKSTQIFDAQVNAPTVPVYQTINGQRTQVGRATLQATDNLYFDLPQDFDMSLLRFNLSVPQALVAPVEAGDNLGTVTVYVQNVRIGRASLVAVESVPEYLSSAPASNEITAIETGVIEYAAAPYVGVGVGEGDILYEGTLPFWMNEYVLALVVPLVISFITLLISLIVYAARRKRRMRRMLHARYARYPEYYRYR